MNKFTNGPWLREGTTVYALMHSGCKKGVEQFKNRFYCSVQHDKDCSEEEAEANATLMAAAPKLLKALEAWVSAEEYVEQYENDDDQEEAANAWDYATRLRDEAIKQARGEL
jgi:hypothetical protein